MKALGFGIAICVLAFAAIGCGHRGAQQKTGVPSGVVLPEWAPKNPSPEFARAAAVLNAPPTLQEMRDTVALPGKSEMEIQAAVERTTRHYIRAYGVFGALTDEQIRQLEDAWEVRIPIKSATPQQRAALDQWFGGGAKGGSHDPLIWLYKEGAKEDLSNVDFGFEHTAARGSTKIYPIALCWWVKQANGKVDRFSGDVVGFTDPSRRK
jgi:hypothetical protein